MLFDYYLSWYSFIIIIRKIKMTSRPVVSVYKSDNAQEIVEHIALPGVFTAPIRNDLVHFVHSRLAKNRR